jgi:hypothetical protein
MTNVNGHRRAIEIESMMLKYNKKEGKSIEKSWWEGD